MPVSPHSPSYLPQPIQSKANEQKTTEITKHLLLIFRRDPTLDTFILLNESGLPISPSSPVLPAQGKNIVVTPMLLVAVTEAMGACREVFGGLCVPHYTFS